MKTFLIRSIVGIFFGAFLSIVMTYTVILNGQETLDSGLFLQNSFGSMLCGWFFAVSSLIFDHHNWSLRRQTVVHFITVIVLYFVLAFGIGWFPFTVEGFLLILVIFVVFYLLFWFAFYFYFKNQAQKMNKELNS
ncbi:hypothetical protein B481_1376 [Planococcus halocryophilus Or1]|uniref:DUF3021 domain-containing protein n=1 Tax=Planococcus halocryophilus TaxID=1215089 RepID=A0A1C7DUS7_9BACL|nr:DUF3021 family protein [Planococcus halocryophilus]ANU15215.1 hypothetical protein BBI08_15745 [Planococcus halocryophilus]EMF46988.1 hypothetical protein B481_1376 [Planococcus halocryophilus Or1]